MYVTGVQERSPEWRDTLGGHQQTVDTRLYDITKRGNITKRGPKTEFWDTLLLTCWEKWHAGKEESPECGVPGIK